MLYPNTDGMLILPDVLIKLGIFPGLEAVFKRQQGIITESLRGCYTGHDLPGLFQRKTPEYSRTHLEKVIKSIVNLGTIAGT